MCNIIIGKRVQFFKDYFSGAVENILISLHVHYLSGNLGMGTDFADVHHPALNGNLELFNYGSVHMFRIPIGIAHLFYLVFVVSSFNSEIVSLINMFGARKPYAELFSF